MKHFNWAIYMANELQATNFKLISSQLTEYSSSITCGESINWVADDEMLMSEMCSDWMKEISHVKIWSLIELIEIMMLWFFSESILNSRSTNNFELTLQCWQIGCIECRLKHHLICYIMECWVIHNVENNQNKRGKYVLFLQLLCCPRGALLRLPIIQFQRRMFETKDSARHILFLFFLLSSFIWRTLYRLHPFSHAFYFSNAK